MGALFRARATWATEIVGRVGGCFRIDTCIAAGQGFARFERWGFLLARLGWVRKCRTIYSVRLWGLIIGKVWKIILRIAEAASLLALRAICAVKTWRFGGWAT